MKNNPKVLVWQTRMTLHEQAVNCPILSKTMDKGRRRTPVKLQLKKGYQGQLEAKFDPEN